jgi:hypothetical protein
MGANLMRIKRAIVIGLVAAGSAFAALSADAAPKPVDPGKVQALVSQIETGLSSEGCAASPTDDVTAIQSAIATSGADPFVARAALHQVQAWKDLCASAAPAVASVDQTITEALEGSTVPHSGGPSGGIPIGAPSSFVSGGGSDYVVVK